MTFYFYDLETSGISAKAQRIMQFAGQRVDSNFKPVGDAQNWLIKLGDEILPDPEAVLLTGITPQKVNEEGYNEAEFLKLFTQHVSQPDTVIVGYNNIRFDDEFMRYTLWRNFYDAYKWQWQDGRSRWDLLDVVRMVRALRPEGIEWPVSEDNKPTNRLELITELNKISHSEAHDALSDVTATISVARLLRDKQPQMFNYLLGLRSKQAVLDLVDKDQPFVYTSGRYSGKWLHTTVSTAIAQVGYGARLVYDLRQDPKELNGLSDKELTERVFSRSVETEILAVKQLRPNTSPAIAPLGVLDNTSLKRLKLDMDEIKANYTRLSESKDLLIRIVDLHKRNTELVKESYAKIDDPDLQLYDDFISKIDEVESAKILGAGKDSVSRLSPRFSDARLSKLWLHYKARNYLGSLNGAEQESWERYRTKRLLEGLPGQLSLVDYVQRLSELSKFKTSSQDQYLLGELQLWAESIAPANY